MRSAGTPIKQETRETKIPRTLKILSKLGRLVTLGKQKTQVPSAQLLRANIEIAGVLRPLYLFSFPSILTITSILRLLSIQHSEGMESLQFNLVPAMTYA